MDWKGGQKMNLHFQTPSPLRKIELYTRPGTEIEVREGRKGV